MINVDKFVYNDEDVLEFIVLKHGSHKQEDHGNWAIGRVSARLTQSILDRVKANGGLSVNMKDGSEPTKGYMVASPVKQAPVVDADDFFNPAKGRKILSDFVKANKKDLGGGKKYLGLWHNKEDNKVYLDVSENVQDKSTATRLGRQRNQISIWDVVNFEEIGTGGTGVTEKRRDSDGGVTIRYIGDDGRTNRFLGGFDLQQTNEVVKHGTHDQQSHAGSRRRIGSDATETQPKQPQGEQEVTDPNAPKPKLKPGRKPDASGTLEERAEKLANGERIQVTKSEAKKIMKIMAKRDDDPDLTNMHIEDTLLYDEDNLGIPRKQMPQVPSDTKGAFINEMEKRGARVQRGVADPAKLHPIQAEMSASKVGLIMKKLREKGVKTDDGGRIVISKDNYVIDGHHRWAAAAMLTFEGNPIKLPVIKVDINHRELIAATLAWNEASGIAGIGMGESNKPGQVRKAWAEFDFIIAKAIRGRTIVRFQPGLKPVVKHQSGNHDQESHGNWAGYPGELQDEIWEEYKSERQKLSDKKIKAGIPEKIAYMSMEDRNNEYFQEVMAEAGTKLTKKQIDEFSTEEQRIENLLDKRSKISRQWYNDHFINTNKNPDKFAGMDGEIRDIRDEYVVKQLNGEDVSVITNRALRAGRGSTRATRFDKLVATGSVKEPVILWRSAILPQDLVDSLQKGSSFIDKGFQSTGVREKEAVFYADQRFRDKKFEGIPVVFKMKVNKGVGAIDVGYGETVLQRNTKMNITNVSSGPRIKTEFDENSGKWSYGPSFVYVDVEVDKA